MNREIKFRAWDAVSEAMYNKVDLLNDCRVKCGFIENSSWGMVTYSIKESQIHLMQFTGLHDKKGLEIYEGDVVALLDNEGASAHYEIKWKEDCYCLVGWNPDEWLMMEEFVGCEVIGNVHENPNLLTQ